MNSRDEDTKLTAGVEPQSPAPVKKGRLRRRILRVFLGFFLFILALVLALQIPFVQTWLGQTAARWVSAKTGFDVAIDRLKIDFLSGLSLHGVIIQDERDTLIFADHIDLQIKSFSTENSKLTIREVMLENGGIYLIRRADDTGTNLDRFLSAFKPEQPQKDKKTGDFILEFERIRLCNARFALKSESGKTTDAAFRSEDMGIRGIYGVVSDFRIHRDTIAMRVEELAAVEKSGMVLKSLSGNFTLHQSMIALKEFRLETGQSQLRGDFAMHFKDMTAFQRFEEEVEFRVDLGLSNVSFQDIQRFSNGIRGWEGDFRIRGEIRGPLSSLKFRNLRVLIGTVTQLEGQLDIMGLPNIRQTYFYFDLDKMVTGYYDLQHFPLPPIQGPNGPEPLQIRVPPEIKRLGVIRFNGNFAGFLHDFTAYGNLQTAIGGLSVDMHMRMPGQDEPRALPTYEGLLIADRFNIGTYLGQQDIGEVSFSGKVNGTGLLFRDLDAWLEGDVHSLTYKNYHYRDIQVAASLREKIFKGSLNIRDPNATLGFAGEINLREAKPMFNFVADIEELHPMRLHLLKLDTNLVVQAQMDINFSGSDIDELIGEIHFRDTRMRKGSKSLRMEDFTLYADVIDSGKVISIRSDFIDADVDGRFRFEPMFAQLNNRLAELLPVTGIRAVAVKDTAGQDFSYAIHFKDPAPITEMFIPELRIHPNSILYGGYNSKSRQVQLSMRSGGIGYGNMFVSDVRVSANTMDNNELLVETRADAFYLTDSIYIDDVNLWVSTRNDSLRFGFNFINEGPRLNSGHIQGSTYLGNAPNIEVKFNDTYFYYNDSLWSLGKEARVELDSGKVRVSRLDLYKFQERDPMLSLNGTVGPGTSDQLKVAFREFPISIVNVFIPNANLELDGRAYGTVSAYQLLQNPFFAADLNVKQLSMSKVMMGDLHIDSRFTDADRVLFLNASLTHGGTEVMTIRNSRIRPFDKEQMLDLAVDLNGLNINAFEGLASVVFSELKGWASGRVNIRGNPEDPYINGALYLDKTRIRVAFLNAPMNLDFESEPILLSNRSIRFPQIKITDDNKGSAQMSGVMYHRMFQDINLNMNIQRIRELQVMNTTRKDNPAFYGPAVVYSQDMRKPGGKAVTIYGPLDNLVISAALDVVEGTEINLPLETRSSATENTFVIFFNSADTLSSASTGTPIKVPTRTGNLTVDLTVSVQPEAMFRVIFDEITNDVLTAQGRTDNFRLSVDMKDKFTMNGSFVIERGEYRFNLSNLVNRQFIIKSGSYVTWTGSPYSAQIEATAIHVTRAPLLPIVAPFSNEAQQELYRRSTRIYCELLLSGNLLDPNLGFDLSLPDSDENARSLVRSVLNTQEEINRQVFALLLLGNFLPPENIGTRSTGGSLAASGLGGNSLSLVSGQINNWLGNFTRDVNVNLEYQAGDQAGNQGDRVTVGLQGQLFNDRVIIDGDLGVGSRNTGAQSQNPVMGNVTVEVKATNDGRLRIRAFNRSNEYNLLKNSVPYTQGVGLSYRREFDTWGELFRGNKATRRQARKLRDQRILEDQISPPTIGDEDVNLLQLEMEMRQQQEETPPPVEVPPIFPPGYLEPPEMD